MKVHRLLDLAYLLEQGMIGFEYKQTNSLYRRHSDGMHCGCVFAAAVYAAYGSRAAFASTPYRRLHPCQSVREEAIRTLNLDEVTAYQIWASTRLDPPKEAAVAMLRKLAHTGQVDWWAA